MDGTLATNVSVLKTLHKQTGCERSEKRLVHGYVKVLNALKQQLVHGYVKLLNAFKHRQGIELCEEKTFPFHALDNNQIVPMLHFQVVPIQNAPVPHLISHVMPMQIAPIPCR